MLRKTTLAILCLQLSFTTFLQAQFKSFNQNSSRSNHYGLSDAWSFGVSTGASFGANSNENTLFRGNSIATKLFGRYYFGNFGLGLSGGIIPGTISNSAVNKFLVARKFPTDATVTNVKPANSYLLFGPSVRFGKRVQFGAEVNGGMFYNNAGGLIIAQQGATRPLYRFDNGSNNLFPGFSGNLHIAYPINWSTHFFINTDYLQTKSAIRLLDPQQGIDVATEQNRTVKLFTVGLGVIKSFGTARETGSGMATGKKRPAGVKYQNMTMRDIAIDEPGTLIYEITTARETGSGMATGRRVLPTVNKRDIAIDESGVHINGVKTPRETGTGQASGRMMDESCGPVTVKSTFPNGITEEKTFSCTNDLAQYERQTQGKTFGEKVNQGLHAAGSALANGASREGIIHRDLAARNILVGRVIWTGSSADANGIATNKSGIHNKPGGAVSSSYAAGLMINTTNSNGIIANIYARETGSGMATGKRSRETGSGMATGRRQYQPVFSEDGSTTSSGNWGTVKSNPMYKGNGNSGTNPMFESSSKTVETGDVDGDGVPELTVYLIDADNGATLATTTTESNGTFFFANLPTGNFIVQVKGNMVAEKQYDVTVNTKSDWAGEILSADDSWSVQLISDTGSVETAQALIKTKTKSNQSNDRTSSSLIWSPRSNKTMNVTAGDLDGDGVNEMIVGTKISDFGMSRMIGGVLPGGSVLSNALRPGNPIPGIIVKGGKNPGGNLRTTFTNEYGEFEFTGLEAGSYSFTTDLNYYINDETYVAIGGNDVAQNIVTSESNLKGDVKITASQNAQSLPTINNNNGMPNRISMNVTVPKQTQGISFGEKVSQGFTNEEANSQRKAQNNNTVRSNRTDNAIIVADLDGDGTMESSFMNITGVIASVNITPPGIQVANGDNAVGGINITEPGIQNINNKIVPVKWMAPEAMKSRVWGDPHVDEKTGTLSLGSGNFGNVYKEHWQSAEVAIKTIRCSDGACIAITAKGEDFPETSAASLQKIASGQPVAGASIYFTDDKGRSYKKQTDVTGRLSFTGLPTGVSLSMAANMGVSGDEDVLFLLSTDTQDKPVCMVLKTKHDTAKNSISNIR